MNISDERLKKFSLFLSFNDAQCAYIKEHSKQISVPAKKELLKLKSKNKKIFLLLEGDLKLVAEDGKQAIVSEGSHCANNVIARIRPCRYQVFTLSAVKLYVFTEKILSRAAAIGKAKDFDAKEEIEHDEIYDKTLFNIISLLHTKQLILPSLPDIALKIRKVVEDENSDANLISKIINMDQSIVTKILRTANSAMYNVSGNKIESSKVAFLRIGTKKLINLVLSYSLKELFKIDSAILKKKMNEVWEHSVKVAAISSILARLTSRLDPEKALLAGLLHNIGAVALLNNLNDDTAIYEDEEKLNKILFNLQSEVGKSILKKWKFPIELVTVTKFSTNWFHNQNENCEYSDIVNIAQLHAYIGTKYQEKLPNINEISAFNRSSLGKLSPELSMRILKKSEIDIQQTMALFK